MFRLPIAFLAASAVAFFATAATAENWKLLKTEADFVSAVVGKTLSGELGTASVKANKTGNGKTAKGKYTVNWVWDNGRYCRNFRFGNKKPTGTRCAYVDVAGNKVRFRNIGGDESVSIWTMK